MTRKTTLIGTRTLPTTRRMCGMSLTMLIGMLVLPALAQAHGGMGPDEVGPPIMTAGLLGFASYWVVMLWPSTHKKNDQRVDPRASNSYPPSTTHRSSKNSARVKRMPPRLRKIEGRGQSDDDHNARRRASDG